MFHLRRLRSMCVQNLVSRSKPQTICESRRSICSLNGRHGDRWICQGRDEGVRRGEVKGGQWVVIGIKGDGPQGGRGKTRRLVCHEPRMKVFPWEQEEVANSIHQMTWWLMELKWIIGKTSRTVSGIVQWALKIKRQLPSWIAHRFMNIKLDNPYVRALYKWKAFDRCNKQHLACFWKSNELFYIYKSLQD